MRSGLVSEPFALHFAQLSIRILAISATIAAITALYFYRIRVNTTTVALTYLIMVLIVAALWGFVESIVASVFAVLCFNFFFLPPILTFTIADPQNWVALFAFLTTAIVASQLSVHGKRRAQEAVARRTEMEQLYSLSRAIMLIDPTQNVSKQIANRIADSFHLRAVALLDLAKGEIVYAGPEDIPGIDARLRAAAAGTSCAEPIEGTIVTAIRLGGEPIGSLALRGDSLSNTAAHALCNLVAVGLEKIRAQQAANQAEAARQSQEFKSTLLDAIAHEFNTPLATIKTATTSVLAEIVRNPDDVKDLLTVIDEEVDRLRRTVEDALRLARLEAGQVRLDRKPHSISPILQSVCEEARCRAEGRPFALTVARALPVVTIDEELIKCCIRQLVDNALKYSSASTPVEISADTDGEGLVISVSDRGPGIPECERARIFEKFYRLSSHRACVPGTGMGLAIARQIVEAHGGLLSVENREGGGARFSISIPLVLKEVRG
jgi:two-component system sensor histidine kinase KdpD